MNNDLGLPDNPPPEPSLHEGEVEITLDLSDYLDFSDTVISVKVPVEYNPHGPEYEHYFENKVITGGLIKWFMDQMFGMDGVPDETIKRAAEIEAKIEAAVIAEYGE